MEIKDYILPYRLLLKEIKTREINALVAQYTPKPYNAFKILPEYRKVIKRNNTSSSSKIENGIIYNHLERDLNEVNKSFSSRQELLASGTDASIFLGMDVFYAYQNVDEYVYEGMSRLTGENLSNMADLSSKVQGYEGNFWSGLPDASISKIGGHIGEVYAAESLGEKGFDVSWANTSNQKGWDLMVNGHEVNVKIVTDANSLSKHFNDYPNIPVIIPSDSANIPDTAIYLDNDAGIQELKDAMIEGKKNLIAVDPSLSSNEIMSQTESATDFLSNSGDIFDTYVPLITVALSGFREFGLIKQGETDILNAAKNLGYDVVGTGVGGVTGAKIGALAGSIFGPIGTAIGGIIGGAGGAIGLRRITDFQKKKKFNSLYLSYQAEKQRFNNNVQSVINSTNKSIMELQSQEERQLREKVFQFKVDLKTLQKKYQSLRRNIYRIDLSDFNKFLIATKLELDSYKTMFLKQFITRPKWKSLLLPNSYDFAREKINMIYNSSEEGIMQLNNNLNKNNDINTIEAFGKVGVAKNAVLSFLKDKELERITLESEYRKAIKKMQAKMLAERHASIKRMARVISTNTREAKNKILKHSISLSEKIASVKAEGKKLGIKL